MALRATHTTMVPLLFLGTTRSNLDVLCQKKKEEKKKEKEASHVDGDSECLPVHLKMASCVHLLET